MIFFAGQVVPEPGGCAHENYAARAWSAIAGASQGDLVNRVDPSKFSVAFSFSVARQQFGH